MSVVPKEVYRRSGFWVKLIGLNEVHAGGDFSAWEQPEFFSAEMRAAFIAAVDFRQKRARDERDTYRTTETDHG